MRDLQSMIFRNLRKQLEGAKLDKRERDALEEGPSDRRGALVLVLSVKYHIEIPEGPFRAIVTGSLDRLYRTADLLRGNLTKESYEDLTPEEKQVFHNNVIEFLLSPLEIDQQKLIDSLDKLDEPERIQFMREDQSLSPALGEAWQALWYYRQNPDELPKDLREKLGNPKLRSERPGTPPRERMGPGPGGFRRFGGRSGNSPKRPRSSKPDAKPAKDE